MASALAPFHCLLVLVITLLVPAIAQVYNNISVGSALFATDDNLTWTSPSGDFAFGFRRLEQDQFLLAIWFTKIPDDNSTWNSSFFGIMNSMLTNSLKCTSTSQQR